MDDELSESSLAEQGQQGAAEGQVYQPQVMQQLAQVAADRRAQQMRQPGMGMQGGAGAMQAPWTQASDQRLQRLSNGLSTIQQQVDSGELAPHEGAAFQQQIQGAMAPLMQQKQQATQAAKQQAVHHALESSAMDMGVRLANMKHLSDAYGSAGIIKHEVDGVPTEFHQDGEGKIVQTDMRKTHLGAMKGMEGGAGVPFGQMPQQAYNPANLKPNESDPPIEQLGPKHPAYLGALLLPSLVRTTPESYQTYPRNPDGTINYSGTPITHKTAPEEPRTPGWSYSHPAPPAPPPPPPPQPTPAASVVGAPPPRQASTGTPTAAQQTNEQPTVAPAPVIPPHIMTIQNGSHIQKFAFQKADDGSWSSAPIYDNRPQDSQGGGGLNSDNMNDLLSRTEQRYIQEHPRPSMYARTPQQMQMARALNAEWNQGLLLRLHAAAQFAQAGMHQNYAVDLANLRSGNQMDQIKARNENTLGQIQARSDAKGASIDLYDKYRAMGERAVMARFKDQPDKITAKAIDDETEGIIAHHGKVGGVKGKGPAQATDVPIPGAAPQNMNPAQSEFISSLK